MSHIEVNILHQAYVLTCPPGQEAQLREAAERVDTQFQRIRNSSKLRSREHVGVLLAVNLAYENLELRNQLQALQLQITALQSANIAEDDALADSDLPTYDAQAAHALIARIDTVLARSSVQTEKPPLASANGLEMQDEITVDVEELELAITQEMHTAAHPQMRPDMDSNTMALGNDNAPILPTTIDEAL
ncbi:MAG: cell division protein ZapA [Comamonas sp.]|nr:cell division protein ZapA [Candidatus Comamonas equi]